MRVNGDPSSHNIPNEHLFRLYELKSIAMQENDGTSLFIKEKSIKIKPLWKVELIWM